MTLSSVRRLLLRTKGSAYVVLFVGLAATASLTAWVVQSEEKLHRLRSQQRAELRIDALWQGMHQVRSEVENLTRVFATVNDLSREQFHEFVRPVLERHPYVEAFAFLRHVTRDERAAFEAGRRLRFPELTEMDLSNAKNIVAGDADFSRFVEYVEPKTSSEMLSGLDATAKAKLDSAIRRATETGLASSTGLIDFFAGPDLQRRRGFMMAMPVFFSALTPENRTGKNSSFGYTVAVMNTPNLMDRLLLQSGLLPAADFDIRLYAGSVPDEQYLAFRSGQSHQAVTGMLSHLQGLVSPPFKLSQTLYFAGSPWHVTIEEEAPPVFEKLGSALLVMMAGLVISILLAAYMHTLSLRSEHIRRKVKLRTAELNLANRLLLEDIATRRMAESSLIESEARFRSLVNLSSDGYWEMDEQMRFKTISAGALRQSGLTADLVMGRTPWESRGAQWEKATYDKLVADIASRRPFQDFEFARIRSDGSIQHALVSGEPTFNANGVFSGYRGVAKDVTERMRRDEDIRRFRVAMDVTADAIFLLDCDRLCFVDVNEAACRMLQYRRDELVGLSPTRIADISTERLKSLVRRIIQGGSLQAESEFIRRDGTRFITEVHRQSLRSHNGMLVVAVARDITDRKRAEEALRQSQENLRQLAGWQENIREEERKRIAREIHDELGAVLTAIRAHLSVASNDLLADGKITTAVLPDAMNLVDGAIDTVRRVISDLRPSVLDNLGVWPAIEWYAGQVQERTGLVCHCLISKEVENIHIDAERSTMLFRVVQEALTNVVRHAHATEVTIRNYLDGDIIHVEIEDNGKGVLAEQLLGQESWGVIGMYERARYCGCELRVAGARSKGTMVSVSVPVRVEPDA